MGIIRWENPEERKYVSAHKDTKYTVLEDCEILKQNPKIWALFRVCETADKAHNLAWLLRERRIKMPDGVFDFVARTKDLSDGSKEFCVYGRFLGEEVA